MSHSQHLNYGRKLPIHQGEWEPLKQQSASALNPRWKTLRRLRNRRHRALDLTRKSQSCQRSKYHANAASYSRLAASWNWTSLLPMRQSGRNPASDVFPRNGLGFPGVQFGNAAAYFLVPSALGSLVNRRVQAFHQRASQVRALLLGERKRLLQQIESLLGHVAIIPRPYCQRVRHRLFPSAVAMCPTERPPQAVISRSSPLVTS
jgi:hypothetical protein